MKEEPIAIDASLVRRLIASQLPQWKELSDDSIFYCCFSTMTHSD
jgi:hypothetical protein